MLVKFSLTYQFYNVLETFFKFMVFTFMENAFNLGIFIYVPVPHSKFQAELFANLFLPTAERVGENYDLLSQN